MRRNLTCAVCAGLFAASVARATIVVDFTIEPGGLYNPLVNSAQVPEAGGRREITVRLHNTSADVDGLGGFQMDLQASATGAVAVGPIGGAGSNGTGLRYNSPDWDANTITGLAISLPIGAIPPAPDSSGLYGTVIVNGNPNAAAHLVGWIVVDLAPKAAGSTITIRPVNFLAFGLFGDDLNAGYGSPATFVSVPEPGMCLFVMWGGVMFVARRRVGGVQ